MTTTSRPSPEPGGTASSTSSLHRRAHRPDIDGLRAVAIIFVVAFHAHVPGAGGGFIGVDVFFVISGYLITRNLVHEVETTGRVALISFWGKRLRRLVPALGLVTLVTLVASVYVLPLYRWGDVARQGGAAALYLSNFLFAWQSEDYFAADVGESPFLHTWSLGVEEQFYVVWPLLFAVVLALVRRRPDRIRPILGVAFGATLVISLAASVLVTPTHPSFAFYLLPTRAWEFAAAGLLALVVLPGWCTGTTARWFAAVAGLGAVAWAGLWISAATPYPGWWAVVPVAGTLLLLMAGAPVAGRPEILPARLLSLSPIQWLGRVSYSWYLWHWPVIVLTVAFLADDRPTVRVLASVAALGLAHLTYHHFENPVRFHRWLTSSNARTIVLAASASVLVVVLAAGIGEVADRRQGGDDLGARLARSRAAVKPTDCDRFETSTTGVEHCVGGDPDADRTVLLVGDSHAGQWVTALDAAAARSSIRFVHHWRGACPVIDVYVTTRSTTSTMDPDCVEHRERTRRLIGDLAPDLVVVASSSEYRSRVRSEGGGKVVPDRAVELWGEALERFVEEINDQGVTVALIVDNPNAIQDPSECMAREGSAEACSVPRAESIDRTAAIREVEEQLVSERGLVSLNINHLLCDDAVCFVEVDGVLVYRDRGHLSLEFTMSRLDELEEFMRRGLASAAGRDEG